MELLPDTGVFLGWDRQDPARRGQARAIVASPDNRIFASAAPVREIIIKRRRGKLQFHGSPVSAIAANGCNELPIPGADAESAGDLSWAHSDPFDRLLVTQARRLTIIPVSADSVIRAFGGVAQLWAG